MMVTRWAALAGALLTAALASAACSSEGTQAAEDCETAPIDTFKELLVVDEAVIGDDRAKNATGGPWSFRYVVENMAPVGMDPAEFVRDWLMTWTTETAFNGFPLDRRDEPRAELRAAEMRRRVLCPWMRATPENQCDDVCGACAGQTLDLAKAPFRLIAIANRIDVRLENLDTAPLGEGRLLFGFTEGPGDDPASIAMPATVIFEYALPKSKTVQQWAETWHALGKFPAFDEGYKNALVDVTDSFVKRGASPEKPNQNAIAQVRTNESALNWMWQLRQFGLRSDGALGLMALHNTPDESFNQSAALANFMRENAEAIKKNQHRVPASMRGASANNLVYNWAAPEIDEVTRRAFAASTCNGCHASEHPAVDTAFHVSPFRKGTEKLSLFVFDPSGKRDDDVKMRTRSMHAALCGR